MRSKFKLMLAGIAAVNAFHFKASAGDTAEALRSAIESGILRIEGELSENSLDTETLALIRLLYLRFGNAGLTQPVIAIIDGRVMVLDHQAVMNAISANATGTSY